ncbi:serine/threonine-protein kinase [Sulfurisphaera tokodaii]|uniref:Protein kinase domain-containing protein n=2 Tax=Sulfurisphaera tokodaii TaxID=111955 RepID=Q973X0_SULTO|nr:serine/threonine-protein kinase [Sulfurisphaera tokodaii]BAB65790.1 putative protein kinase [Sulfurisphaera tokodaii str. 7]HII74455.1 protein kinase [Sulfurisphaera tokodaii]
MDYYKLNRLLSLGNLAVVSYFILENGIEASFLPLLSFAVSTSISSSPFILGLSLIVGSALLPLFFLKEISIQLLVFALVITLLSIFSIKFDYLKFVPFPLSLIFYFFLHPISSYFFSFIVLGSILLIIKKKIVPSLIFTVAIPFFLVQIFFLYSISLTKVGVSLFALNEMASMSKFMLPADIIVILVSYLKRESLYSIITTLVIVVSLGISVLFLYVNPPFSLMYSSSSAIVSSSLLSDSEIEKSILENLNDEKKIKNLLFLYRGDITSFCQKLVYKGNCEALVKISEIIPYKINYSLCDLHKIADCYEKLKKVPSRDIISFLSIVKEKDIELAERIGRLALSISPSPKLMKLMEEIEVLRMESLKYNWDPKVWVNRIIHGYRIIDYLGKGGSAYVLIGEKDNKKYAIKIPILIPLSNVVESYYDFINEYSQLRELSLSSDSIVRFVDAIIDVSAIKRIKDGDVLAYLNEPPILVMEFMEGKSVKELIQNDNVYYSDEWEKIVLLIALEVVKSLEDIHKAGFVHLDIKPSNILFSSLPGKTGKEVLDNLTQKKVKIKISDLGSARKIGEKFSQYTPEYCSVDQVEAIVEGKGADPSMDIYSLGATIYKMLTRKDFNPPELIRLFNEASIIYSNGGDPKPILQKAKEVYKEYYMKLEIPDVDQRFKDLVKELVNPEKRPTASEVYNKLKEILNNDERNSNPR